MCPSVFLNDESSYSLVVETVYKIEQNLEHLRDANKAYDSFKQLIFSEMDNKLFKRSFHRKRIKSLYKPYWSEELDVQWDAVRACERKWLQCNGMHSEKRRLQALYVTERRQFEKNE